MLSRKNKVKTPVYASDPNEDRYNPALRAFHDINAEARVQRHNALLFAWGALVLAGIMGFGMISASHQPKLIPYIVEVDRHGSAVNMGIPPRLDQSTPAVSVAIEYQLRQFIQAMRGVTLDPVFQKKMIEDYVKPFVEPNTDAAAIVNDFYTKNDPFTLVKQKGQIIDVTVDQPLAESPSTYELHWFETTRSLQGDVIAKTEWKCFATIELHQVGADLVRLNPLGMYVTKLTIQQVAFPAANTQETQQ